jgi:hypothetical protein
LEKLVHAFRVAAMRLLEVHQKKTQNLKLKEGGIVTCRGDNCFSYIVLLCKKELHVNFKFTYIGRFTDMEDSVVVSNGGSVKMS